MKLIATYSLLAGIMVTGIGCEGQPPAPDGQPPARQEMENEPDQARPITPAVSEELNRSIPQEDPASQPGNSTPLNLPPSQSPAESSTDFKPSELPDKSALPENKTSQGN